MTRHIHWNHREITTTERANGAPEFRARRLARGPAGVLQRREDEGSTMVWSESATLPYSTETVWNAGLEGTSVANDGRSLTVGRDGEWAPEYLLLLAAESCFMSTLLALARQAGLDVLGYVSKGHLATVPPHPDAPIVALTPCVVVASDDDVERIAKLAAQVTRTSVVARLLGDRLRVNLDVRAVGSASR
jgi:organic hydroperoxide reductase OsmC/OhrA